MPVRLGVMAQIMSNLMNIIILKLLSNFFCLTVIRKNLADLYSE